MDHRNAMKMIELAAIICFSRTYTARLFSISLHHFWTL